MTFFEFVNWLHFAPAAILIAACFTGLKYYKSLNTVHKCITWYLLGMLVVDIASRIVGETGNNLIVLLIYSLFEMAAVAFFYFRYLFKAKHRLIQGLCIAAFIYIAWEIVIFDKDIKRFQSYAKVVDDFIIIILALSFFHEKINIFKESKWDNFGLNAVIVVFFSINLAFFLPLNFLLNDSFGMYFFFGNIFSLSLFYLYLTHSIWRNGRTQKLLLSGLR